MRLFSSDKHHGMVNSGDCERSKYDPKIGSFNFAVPNERLLKKSRTGLPKVINCGLIRESIPFIGYGKGVCVIVGWQTSSTWFIK